MVVDGIVGIGGRGGLRENAANALKLLHGVPVVAVDTPSGVGRRHRRGARATTSRRR